MREEKHSQNQEKEKSFKRLLRKRWVLPAVYLGSAALILSSFFWMQNATNEALPEDEMEIPGEFAEGMDPNQEAIPVTTTNEVFQMPVIDENEAKVVGHFYDYDATAEEQQAALVYYNNTYYQNKGIDIATENGESFDVTASLSGAVVKAEKDSLLGYVVQIDHDNGVVTHYQSLEDIQVEEGQTVKQGDIIGRAGRNAYNADAGVHVHYEIRQDGIPVNPIDYFNQPITALPQEDVAEDEEGQAEGTEEETPEPKEGAEENVEDEASNEGAPAEEEEQPADGEEEQEQQS